MQCLHILPVQALFRYSGFLPHSKTIAVRLISGAKLTLWVSVSAQSCLSHLYLCLPCDSLVACFWKSGFGGLINQFLSETAQKKVEKIIAFSLLFSIHFLAPASIPARFYSIMTVCFNSSPFMPVYAPPLRSVTEVTEVKKTNIYFVLIVKPWQLNHNLYTLRLRIIKVCD